MTALNRREFLLAAAATAAASASSRAATAGFTGQVCFFSKHLPDPDWQRLAQNVKRLGCDGVDLTVRTGGHVNPENAADELPKAVAAMRAEGLAVPMITTGLTSAKDATAQAILATAGKLSIPYFKAGYYKYKFTNVRAELQQAAQAFGALAALGKQHGVQAGFHNHAGYIGGSLWDFVPLMDQLDASAGWYYDPRHAMAEGGAGAWKAALQLIAPRIKMIAVKDFYWEKTAKGWSEKNCPLGAGMVNWQSVFATLANHKFSGPISLHVEYEVGGKTAIEQEDNMMLAAQRDLAFLKTQLQAAYKNNS